MCSTIFLSPADIRFVQDSISPRFRNGNYVNYTIEKIAQGLLRVEALPKIRVTKIAGDYFSLDNRRLYVYRVLHYRGLLNLIQVYFVPTMRCQSWKFTTKNNGTSLYVRRGVTKPHYRAPTLCNRRNNDVDNLTAQFNRQLRLRPVHMKPPERYIRHF